MTGDAHQLPSLPPRDPKGHKGTFGTVTVVGGCAHGGSMMLGGPCISAIAALRAGAGLVKLALPASIMAEGLSIAPSATGVPLPTGADGDIDPSGAAAALDGACDDSACVAVGPGLGRSPGAEAVTERLIGRQGPALVVDADAINALSQIPELTTAFRAHAVLTPHPGEYRRLASSLNLDEDPADASRRARAAVALAQRLGCVVVLKGAGTVVSDGQRTWTDEAAPNPALATAGTGDALTGCLAALIAQHHRDPILAGERSATSEMRGGLSLFDCARLAVRMHSVAAGLWVERAGTDGGMLAMELCELLPTAAQSLRGD